MIPNIILEGPDGGGKTTAAKLLVNWLEYSYRHDGPPPQEVDDGNCLDYYYILYESFPKPFVWDRSIFGELVYGPIFRKKSRLRTEQVDAFIADFKEAGGISVLLLPPLEIILNNWRKNQEAQKMKAVGGTRESSVVKRDILDDPDLLSQIYDGYMLIADRFDYVIKDYTNQGHWITILGRWLRRPGAQTADRRR